jgi:hypothetical protein
MNDSSQNINGSQSSPRVSKSALSNGRVLLATMLVLSAGSLLLGFVAGWKGSRRLYVSTRNENRPYTILAGDASEDVSIAVKRALQEFQDGYTSRDPRQLSTFMDRLFPNDEHILVCGTDAGEWIQGRASVQRFIGGDWTSWGSVRLATNEPVISSSGDVAWLATTGTVIFHDRPRTIRFLAVLQRTGDRWVFRQIQCQWDEWDTRPARLSELIRPSTLVNLHID